MPDSGRDDVPVKSGVGRLRGPSPALRRVLEVRRPERSAHDPQRLVQLRRASSPSHDRPRARARPRRARPPHAAQHRARQGHAGAPAPAPVLLRAGDLGCRFCLGLLRQVRPRASRQRGFSALVANAGGYRRSLLHRVRPVEDDLGVGDGRTAARADRRCVCRARAAGRCWRRAPPGPAARLRAGAQALGARRLDGDHVGRLRVRVRARHEDPDSHCSARASSGRRADPALEVEAGVKRRRRSRSSRDLRRSGCASCCGTSPALK